MTTPSADAVEAARKIIGWVDACVGDVYLLVPQVAAEIEKRSAPPEHPTPEMIAAGVLMHQTPRTGPPETLVHDIYQAMYEEWKSS